MIPKQTRKINIHGNKKHYFRPWKSERGWVALWNLLLKGCKFYFLSQINKSYWDAVHTVVNAFVVFLGVGGELHIQDILTFFKILLFHDILGSLSCRNKRFLKYIFSESWQVSHHSSFLNCNTHVKKHMKHIWPTVLIRHKNATLWNLHIYLI